MSSIWMKTDFNAAAIPGGVFVSLARLAICGIAIRHHTSIIPAVKVLKTRVGQPRG